MNPFDVHRTMARCVCVRLCVSQYQSRLLLYIVVVSVNVVSFIFSSNDDDNNSKLLDTRLSATSTRI